MKLLSRSMLGLAVTLVIVTSSAAKSQSSDDTSVEGLRQGKLFLGALYSTVTRLSVSLTTTGTRFFTCISAIDNTVTCTGRRRRKRRDIQTLQSVASLESQQQRGPVPLHSSLQPEAEAGVLTDSAVRDAKGILLTIFTTTTSSLTLGTYFSDTGTTVSISVACFDPSFSFPPTC